MKICNIILVFINLLISVTCYSQIYSSRDINLDFEKIENNYPLQWNTNGTESYSVYSDSKHIINGKYSVVIESSENDVGYKALALNLPNIKGTLIRLSGYIKTENVKNGYAGLWMRIDPKIGFDNMNDRGIQGTTDWKKYEITLPLQPENTNKIVIGGLLVGKGKMWLDNLQVSIDGIDIKTNEVQIYERKAMAAESDKEFDKSSNINFENITDKSIKDLELLGKIWGFMKYYHPNITQGNYNWDYELFRIIPTYMQANNNEDRNEILSDWINKFGPIKICNKCVPTAPDAILKPDFSFIDNSNLSTSLKNLLREIYKNRNQGFNYYVTVDPNNFNPSFTHENNYSDMVYPDSGFRILSLFRYWNMIQYFFPNRHLTDKKWDMILKEYIPLFINAKNELEYELSVLRMVGEIKDTHANLWGRTNKIEELRGKYFAPFKVRFIGDKLVVVNTFMNELPDSVQLKNGDIITHIDSREVMSIVDTLKNYYPSSNEASMLRDISEDLLRSKRSVIHLKYISGGRRKQLDIPLYDIDMLNVYVWNKKNEKLKSFKLLDDNIGYITLENIKEEDIPEIKKKFINTKAIIIDIRNYPSTFVPFALGSYFVSESTSFVKYTVPDINNPGAFTFREGEKIESDGNNYKGKLVILVNEKTQSQAEYTAMAFKAAKNSVIVGNTTAGADGNISEIILPGGLKTQISGIGIYYPDGKETQRIGIVPDIIVKPSINGIIQNKDEILERAIKIINRN